MNFNIDITVASSEQAIARHETALDQTAAAATKARTAITGVAAAGEDVGKKVTAGAVDSEAAMRKLDVAAGAVIGDYDKLRALVAGLTGDAKASAAAAESTGKSMADWATEMERQAKVLERIKAPMREYKADVAALEALMAKGEITAAEYDNEVDKLSKKAGAWQGPIQQIPKVEAEKAAVKPPSAAPTITTAEPGGNGEVGSSLFAEGLDVIAPKFGAAGELLAHLATEGTVAVAAVAAVASEVTHLGNEYIELANKAQKLTEKGGDINETLRVQLALSKDLHGSLDGTVELYDAVRDGTDELNLSQRDQLELTKDIGSAVVASGKSVEQAGGLMAKLTYAFSSGAIGGRELKGIMKEFPDIGAAFVEAMGHSRKELIDLANKGQISSDMLIAAFRKMGPEMEEKVGKRAETTGQMWQHFTDTLTLSIGKFAESTGAFRAMSSALDELGNAAKITIDLIDTFNGSVAQVKDLSLTKGGLGGWVDGFTALGEAINNLKMPNFGAASGVDDRLIKQQGDVTKAYIARMEVLKLLGVEEEKNAKTAAIAASAKRLGIDVGQFDEASANKIAEMRITLRAAGIDIADAFDEAHNKATLLNTQLTKLDESKAAKDLSEDAHRIWTEMHGVNELMDDQAKKWTVLNDRSALLKKAIAEMKALGGPTSQAQRELEREKRDIEIKKDDSEYGQPVLGSLTGRAHAADELRDLTRAAKDGKIAGDELRQKYDQLMTTINNGRLPETIKFWEALHLPVQQFQRDISALNALMASASHRISASEYESELSKATADRIAFLEANNPSLNRKLPDLAIDTAAYEKTNNELGDNQAGIDPLGYKLEQHAKQIQIERVALAKLREPAERYKLEIAGLGDLLERGKLSSERYTQAIDASRAAFLASDLSIRTFGERVELAWLKAKQGALDAGVAVKSYARVAEETKVAQITASPGTRSTDDLVAIALLKDKQAAEQAGVAASSYAQVIDRVRAAQLAASADGKTFEGGLESAWLKAKADAEEFGATLANTLVGDVDKLNNAIVTAANGGEVAWGQMVDSMIQDLERLIIKQLEVAAITALLNALIPGSGTAASASGLTGSLADAFPHGDNAGPITLPSQLGSSGPGAYPTPAAATSSPSSTAAPSAAPPSFKIVNIIDPSVVHAAMSSREGEQIILNTMTRNKTAVRG